MYKSTKIVVALAAAGVVATAGTAFTATSDIDVDAINVGSVAQSVSGANITSVVHEYTAASDTTTKITANAEELLSADSVKIAINTKALEVCTVALTDLGTVGVDDGAGDFSSITCDIADTVNVTSVRFVVNG